MDITVLLVSAIILIIVAFFVGRKFASKPIEDRNEEIKQNNEKLRKKLEQENHELDKAIERKEAKLEAAVKQSEIIEAQYKQKLKVIQDTKQLADEELETRRKLLEQQFDNEKEELKNQKTLLIQEIEKIKLELQSLQETKKAVLEANRKEKELKENKDYFTLTIPKEEQRDIAILEETKMRISKPRALSMVIWTAYYQQVAKTKFPKILGKQNVCGIYKITNLKTEECYIGQAKDVRLRWNDHVKAGIGIDTPAGNKLYASMQEYGIENFAFELLEECSADDLNKKEKYFISLYNSNSLGFNSTKGTG